MNRIIPCGRGAVDNMKKMVAIAFAVFGLAASLSAQQVRYKIDRKTDFGKFKTYKWLEIPGEIAKLDDVLGRELISAVEAGLAAKGLTKFDNDTPDLHINYHAAAKEDVPIDIYTLGRGTAETSILTVGSVSLEMYEASTKHLVWRGVVTRTIHPGATADRRKKGVETSVTMLLENYPPKKNK
jgi:hypothetical protein